MIIKLGKNENNRENVIITEEDKIMERWGNKELLEAEDTTNTPITQ